MEFTPAQPPEANTLNPELARRLVDVSPVVSFVLAPDGKPKFVSPAVEKVFGHTPQEVLSGEADLESTVHTDDQERSLKELTDWDKSGELSREYRVKAKDGKEHWVKENRRVVNGEVIGTVTDNTEAIVKGVQLTANTAAHNLNNLLTPVISSVGVIKLDLPDASQQTIADLDRIQKSGLEAAQRVRKLKDLADKGSLELLPGESILKLT